MKERNQKTDSQEEENRVKSLSKSTEKKRKIEEKKKREENDEEEEEEEEVENEEETEEGLNDSSQRPYGSKFIDENEAVTRKASGRRKINIEFITNKSKRHVTFSKRKHGLIKKAFELSTLTGTQVLLLVASETGNVYTFATPKLQPLITNDEGKRLIQSCLNPDLDTSATTNQDSVPKQDRQKTPNPQKFEKKTNNPHNVQNILATNIHLSGLKQEDANIPQSNNFFLPHNHVPENYLSPHPGQNTNQNNYLSGGYSAQNYSLQNTPYPIIQQRAPPNFNAYPPTHNSNNNFGPRGNSG